MSDNNESTEAGLPKQKANSHQGRSPAYPYISLGKAIQRAVLLKEAEGFYAVPMSSAYKAWGISEKSSASPQVMAALKHFGLLEYEGSGQNRSVKLSDLSKRIILDVRPNSEEKANLIKQAGLTPSIHKELLEKYPDGLPSDATLQTFLVLDRGFNEKGAQALISEFKDTISFANLGKSDIIPKSINKTDGDDFPPLAAQFEVGDLVQIEINGVLQLTQPERIRSIQEYQEADWVFIEGTETGFPMEQVILQEKQAKIPQKITPPVLPLNSDRHLQENYREDKASLDEGEVVLHWPETLSSDSVADFEYWVNGIIHRAKRRAGIDIDSDQ